MAIHSRQKKKKPKTQKQIDQCQQLGHARKKSILTELLKRTTVWKYEKNQQILFKKIQPQNSLNTIIQMLETALLFYNKPSISHLDTSVFYKVIKGQRKKALGWSLFFIYV
jgi:hypothetical protein